MGIRSSSPVAVASGSEQGFMSTVAVAPGSEQGFIPPVAVASTNEMSGMARGVATAPTAPPNDLRARLRAKDSAQAYDLIYAGPAEALRSTGGLVWPYTPTITYSQDVAYADMSPVHSNQEILSYTRTPAVKFTVVGNFTSQTQEEALYNLACIHFLRVVTKMSFGSSLTPQPGTPPPVLIFEAHGGAMFNKLPVVVTQFSITMPPDHDYIAVNTGSGISRVPVFFDISVSLTVQNTPQALRRWSLDTFRSGGYLTKGGGWV